MHLLAAEIKHAKDIECSREDKRKESNHLEVEDTQVSLITYSTTCERVQNVPVCQALQNILDC